MSRGYRIELPDVVARADVSGRDEVCIDVQMLPILGADDMRAVLRDQLAQQGWTNNDDGSMTRELQPGLTATLSPDGTHVTASWTTTTTVQARGFSEQQAQTAARQAAQAAQGKADRSATEALARAEGDVRAALQEALQRAYLEALQQKARSLGDVQSVQQGTAADGSLEITIKVRA